MRRIPYLLLSLLFIAADQLSKWAVSELLIRPRVMGEGTSVALMDWYAHPPVKVAFGEVNILPFFNFVMVWNRGISFGLFNHGVNEGPMILTGISLLITAVFIVLVFRTNSWVQLTGIALIIGGAVGNVIDRARFGAVIDFIDIHAGNYHWPAFNIADSCICTGVAVLIVRGMFFDKPVSRPKASVIL